MLLRILLITVCQLMAINSKRLWDLEDSGRLLHERHLSGRSFKNPRFHELKNPALFSVSPEDLLQIKAGYEISVDVISPDGESIRKSCLLKKGILGLPNDPKSKVKSYSCSTGTFEELQLIINTEEENGLAATYFRDDGSAVYINAAFDEGNIYIMYDVKAFLNEASSPPFEHQMVTPDELINPDRRNLRQERKLQIRGTDVIEYRVAILTSPEFASAAGGSVAAVSSNIQQVVSRTNGIYLRDVGIFWKLADNFERGICLQSSGGVCNNVGNFGGFATGGTVGNTLEQLGIPADSYDAAQLLFFSLGAGGRAVLDSICLSDRKTDAASNGASGLSGFSVDAFVVFMFAHELGHQVGAGHSFRDCSSQNSGRTDSQAVEPGGGTTIMSLAGVCGGTTNLILDRESYFHSVSRAAIRDLAERRFENINCGRRISLNLPTSTLTTPNRCSVPIGNSFLLSGASSRSTSNRFYSWERVDTGPVSYDAEQFGRFRAYEAVQNRVDRFFPNLHYQNFFQDRDFEILPTVTSSMTFRFIERSNFNPSASQASLDTSVVSAYSTKDTVVQFVNSQRFSVTAPANGATINIDKGFELKWNPGSLGNLSPDGRIKIFFAENTMQPIALSNLQNLDYRRDIDDLNWREIADVTVNSGGVCTAISSDIVNTNNLNGIKGNIMVRVSTSQDNGARVTDAGNCFVTALVKDVRLVANPEEEDLCVLGVVLNAPNNAEGGSGLSSGGTATLVIFFIGLSVLAGFFVYKRRMREERDFHDNMSLNSKKPRASPLSSTQRWSNKRINLDAAQSDEETFRQKLKAYASSKLAKGKETFQKVKTSIKNRAGSKGNDEEEDAVSVIQSIVSVGVQRQPVTKIKKSNATEEVEQQLTRKTKHLSSKSVLGAFKWQSKRSKSTENFINGSNDKEASSKLSRSKVFRAPSPPNEESRTAAIVGGMTTALKSLRSDLFSSNMFTKNETESTTPEEEGDVKNEGNVEERMKSRFGFTLPKLGNNDTNGDKEGGVKSTSRNKEAERKGLANRYPFDNLTSNKILKPRANKKREDEVTTEANESPSFSLKIPRFKSLDSAKNNREGGFRSRSKNKSQEQPEAKGTKFSFKVPKFNSVENKSEEKDEGGLRSPSKNNTESTKFSFKIPKLNTVEKPNLWNKEGGFRSRSKNKASTVDQGDESAKFSFKLPKLNSIEKKPQEKREGGFRNQSRLKPRAKESKKDDKDVDKKPPPVRRNPTVAALRARFERKSNESLSY